MVIFYKAKPKKKDLKFKFKFLSTLALLSTQFFLIFFNSLSLNLLLQWSLRKQLDILWVISLKRFLVWGIIDFFSDVPVLQVWFDVSNHMTSINSLLVFKLRSKWKCCFFFTKVSDINRYFQNLDVDSELGS